MLAGCSAWTPLVRAGRGRTSCSPAGVGGGGGRGVLTTGEHLGVLAEVQEHHWVFCEGILMAVTQAAGEHLGAAEEEQGELKDKKDI